MSWEIRVSIWSELDNTLLVSDFLRDLILLAGAQLQRNSQNKNDGGIDSVARIPLKLNKPSCCPGWSERSSGAGPLL